MTRFRKVELSGGTAGRLYLHSMPGRYERLEDAWAEVRGLGISTIICLAPLDEIREKSPEYSKSIEIGTVPCDVRRLPVCDYQGPDDDRAFSELSGQVADLLRRGEGILIHCGAGVGRTGMFAIAALMGLGLSADEARRQVRAAGSGPERPAQEEALRRFGRLRHQAQER